ncbi:MAG: FAD-dependent oxidoreductase [Snowella sp.]|nr:FAD-dependent oxidoreductase [Snowella sp.]
MTAKSWLRVFTSLPLGILIWQEMSVLAWATPPRSPDQKVECEILVVGGGLAGSAAAYEGLLAGKTVCLTDITDWVGGQISSQGTSALDERPTQARKLYFSRGYLDFRKRIEQEYDSRNPGHCWVSESCFLPADGHKVLMDELKQAERKGNGKLKWFPNTVIKELGIKPVGQGQQITRAIAIQHQPAKGAPPLNTYPLSQTFEDSYRYENSRLFDKTIIQFIPKPVKNAKTPPVAPWYIIEATETGELIALADVPYRVGIDPLSYLEPSASSKTPDPYCTQGFTYTFAMEKTAEPQPQTMPPFYPQYEPYYSYELPRFTNPDLLFTYRQIWSPEPGEILKYGGTTYQKPKPGNISMQNWTWGNDYRPGTSQDNFIYTHDQLATKGQLKSGGWLGGLRTDAFRKAEEHALGFYYWFVKGTTDSRLGDGVKKPDPNNLFLSGLDSPMGTVHGLSKYPYIRESRRIIGRPSFYYPNGFTISEVDISRRNYQDEYYKQNLPPDMYRQLQATLAGLEGLDVLSGKLSPDAVQRRKRSTIYADSVGIGHYAIDFHPCMTLSPPEAPGNTEKEGERQGGAQAYPFQIPLRAMIPQKIDNMLVAGKAIAVSHIASAAYRVHSYEWSSGAAAGTVAAFALDQNIMPYQMVQEPLVQQTKLRELQALLNENNNPTAFPDTSIFNDRWDDWK